MIMTCEQCDRTIHKDDVVWLFGYPHHTDCGEDVMDECDDERRSDRLCPDDPRGE